MKSIVSITASAAFVLGLAMPVLAGPVGIQRQVIVPRWQAQQELPRLQSASDQAQVAAQGSKNHLPFTYRSYDIDRLIAKIQNGEPVTQAQIDWALQPVVLN